MDMRIYAGRKLLDQNAVSVDRYSGRFGKRVYQADSSKQGWTKAHGSLLWRE